MSLASTVGSAIYKHYLTRSNERLRAAAASLAPKASHSAVASAVAPHHAQQDPIQPGPPGRGSGLVGSGCTGSGGDWIRLPGLHWIRRRGIRPSGIRSVSSARPAPAHGYVSPDGTETQIMPARYPDGDLASARTRDVRLGPARPRPASPARPTARPGPDQRGPPTRSATPSRRSGRPGRRRSNRRLRAPADPGRPDQPRRGRPAPGRRSPLALDPLALDPAPVGDRRRHGAGGVRGRDGRGHRVRGAGRQAAGRRGLAPAFLGDHARRPGRRLGRSPSAAGHQPVAVALAGLVALAAAQPHAVVLAVADHLLADADAERLAQPQLVGDAQRQRVFAGRAELVPARRSRPRHRARPGDAASVSAIR